MKVEQILHVKGTEVFAIGKSATIEDALDVLSVHNIGAVVVKDIHGSVVGILSERDIVRDLQKKGASLLDQSVEQSMTANPYTCTMDTPIDDLMGQMTAKRIRHMPVLKGEALIGVVSIGDVVKRKIEQTEQEAAALKEYIAS